MRVKDNKHKAVTKMTLRTHTLAAAVVAILVVHCSGQAVEEDCESNWCGEDW